MRLMKWMACGALLLGVCLSASAQKIKGRYVSKVQEDGTIYHTFPETLFSSREAGDLTFDITYKTRQDGTATVNFTYYAAQAAPSDSVRFEAGKVTLAGPVEKIYIEPEKKRWVHRYTFSVDADALARFFDPAAQPEATLYPAGGRPVRYHVQKSAWRDYAPVASKIFEMIRYNEAQ
ncbi:MAG: hypothetical protein ACLSVO_06560 [Alistipes sp.]|uniref:hypothetical protein n=2 Tax=Rikenellaceae TaxID=171550 RepID=UPI0025BB922E|nr:hypothetical protein [Alistipes sp.]